VTHTRRTERKSAITVSGLRKAFGDQTVLDGIDLDVAEGTVFALLGPNGAGKPTTVQILSTLIRPDAGEISVAGHDPRREPDAVRAAIGLTLERHAGATPLQPAKIAGRGREGQRVPTIGAVLRSSARPATTR
jgi:ABC-type uncharacterized transport system ATPase subunit